MTMRNANVLKVADIAADLATSQHEHIKRLEREIEWYRAVLEAPREDVEALKLKLLSVQTERDTWKANAERNARQLQTIQSEVV